MDQWILIKAIPFVIGAAAGATLARRSHGAGGSWRTRAAGGTLLACAIVLACLMAIHTAAVPLFRYLEPGRVPAAAGRSVMVAGIRYDHRFYSLVLMGVVMLRFAASLIRSTAGVARGEAAAGRKAWRAIATLSALTTPLIPLSFEAWLYGAVIVAGAASLAIAKTYETRGEILSGEQECRDDPSRFPEDCAQLGGRGRGFARGAAGVSGGR